MNKKCKKGASCGESCISQQFKCKKALSGAASGLLNNLLDSSKYTDEIGEGSFGSVKSNNVGIVLKTENLAESVKRLKSFATDYFSANTEDELYQHYENTKELQNKAASEGLAPKVLSSGREGSSYKQAIEELESYETLGDLLSQGSLSPLTNVKDLVKNKLEKALQDLRLLDISHNDLHVGNVMVDPYSADVKLIDFGLASKLSLASKSGNDFDRESIDQILSEIEYL